MPNKDKTKEELLEDIKLLQKRLKELEFLDAEHNRVEQRLRDYIVHLSYLTKYANDIIILLNSKFRFLEINERVIDVYGYTREELIGMSASQLRAPETRPNFNEQVKPLLETGKVVYETIHQRKDRTKFPVEISLRAIDVEKRRLYQAIIRDITERKRIEAELAQAKEQQYRTLIENLPGKVFLKDKDLVFVSCNQNFAKDLGIKPEEIAGKTDFDFFPKLLAEKYRTEDKEVLASGETENLEEEYLVMNDFVSEVKKTVINIVKVPVRDKAGNITGLFGLFWDITERKRIEDALYASERTIRAIFDQTFQFIGMMTLDGKLIEANRTAMLFAGINEADCIGKFFWDTPWWSHSKELQNKLREAVSRAAEGETVFFEATHLAADKSLHYIDFSLKPVKDEHGKVAFLIPEGRDITERKRIEEELKKTRNHLNELVKEKKEKKS